MTTRATIVERITALDAYFQRHGWPVAGRDIERETKGRVSKLFVCRFATGPGRGEVTAIGNGLYVPADRAGKSRPPMSPEVASAMLAFTPDDIIDDYDHLRLFKLAMIMARLGMAIIRKSRTTRGGIRRQTLRVTFTDAGRAMLEAKVRLAKDEF